MQVATQNTIKIPRASSFFLSHWRVSHFLLLACSQIKWTRRKNESKTSSNRLWFIRREKNVIELSFMIKALAVRHSHRLCYVWCIKHFKPSRTFITFTKCLLSQAVLRENKKTFSCTPTVNDRQCSEKQRPFIAGNSFFVSSGVLNITFFEPPI